ncbi:MAG: tetratricopeptide repeat protein [Prevotella sp.]|nr:tetratricopeptide repeat protein [Prevotella sp.]
MSNERHTSAQEYFEQGNAHRQQGQWQEAINCYNKAIELDPDSPAVVAKRMLDDIMNYYCKDLYNP